MLSRSASFHCRIPAPLQKAARVVELFAMLASQRSCRHANSSFQAIRKPVANYPFEHDAVPKEREGVERARASRKGARESRRDGVTKSLACCIGTQESY